MIPGSMLLLAAIGPSLRDSFVSTWSASFFVTIGVWFVIAVIKLDSSRKSRLASTFNRVTTTTHTSTPGCHRLVAGRMIPSSPLDDLSKTIAFRYATYTCLVMIILHVSPEFHSSVGKFLFQWYFSWENQTQMFKQIYRHLTRTVSVLLRCLPRCRYSAACDTRRKMPHPDILMPIVSTSDCLLDR